MTKWEYAKAELRSAKDRKEQKKGRYFFIFQNSTEETKEPLMTNDFLQKLNGLGKIGWEIVTQDYDKKTEKYFWTFKRQLK